MFKVLFVAALLALAAADPEPAPKAKPLVVAAYSAPVVAGSYAAHYPAAPLAYSAPFGYPYAYSGYNAPIVVA